MGDEFQGLPGQFIMGKFQHLADRLVALEQPSVQADQDDSDGRLLEDGPEPGFALAQGLFGFYSLGNIPRHTY